MTFAPETASIPEARRFVDDVILDWGDLDSRYAVRLLTSEVATNAVQHGRTDFRVSVATRDDVARVEVFDANPRLPATCTAPADASSGKGLVIIDAMAADWGAEPSKQGKLVWFEVAAPTLR
jgi:anti-sigma regulatory factor (Ser/Thr protein kinase)